MSKKCNHDWSFDVESSDHKIGVFACNLCGKQYESEGVPDFFYQPSNILDQLKIEVIRHSHTTTSLVCYEAIQKINLNQETIRTQQATIERLTEQRDRLLKSGNMVLRGHSSFDTSYMAYCIRDLQSLIAEIESSK